MTRRSARLSTSASSPRCQRTATAPHALHAWRHQHRLPRCDGRQPCPAAYVEQCGGPQFDPSTHRNHRLARKARQHGVATSPCLVPQLRNYPRLFRWLLQCGPPCPSFAPPVTIPAQSAAATQVGSVRWYLWPHVVEGPRCPETTARTGHDCCRCSVGIRLAWGSGR